MREPMCSNARKCSERPLNLQQFFILRCWEALKVSYSSWLTVPVSVLPEMACLHYLLVLGMLLGECYCCNKRTIVLRGPVLRRNKCEGCGSQADVGVSVSLPPEQSPLPTVENSTTLPPVTTSIPAIPIGDCKCGMNVYGEDKHGQLHRPWLVHIDIQLENKEHIQCSGSLLNKRWIISAAHCFCPLLEVVLLL